MPKISKIKLSLELEENLSDVSEQEYFEQQLDLNNYNVKLSMNATYSKEQQIVKRHGKQYRVHESERESLSQSSMTRSSNTSNR